MNLERETGHPRLVPWPRPKEGDLTLFVKTWAVWALKKRFNPHNKVRAEAKV